MGTLSLSFLGSFQAQLDGKPLKRFRTKSAQALLIYLTAEHATAAGISHPRDSLLGLFWPELPQTSAQKRLRDALYLLRKVVPEVAMAAGDGSVPFLLTDRHSIQVNPSCTYDLDVRTFTRMLQGGYEQWPEAIALYRGDFLADFYLPDSAAFEQWVNGWRTDLRRQMLDALDALTGRSIEGGDFKEADQYVRRQLRMDPLRESGHRHLMEILVRGGRRRAALSQYEHLVELMYQELAVEPSAESQALYQAIRDGEYEEVRGWQGESVEEFDAIKPGQYNGEKSPIPHNLPSQPTPFIGRERELAELAVLLEDPNVRLIAIVGPGGMGKTRLALALALAAQMGSSASRPSFEHGLFFVDLAPLDDVEQMVPTLAQVFNFPLQGGEGEKRPPRQQILDYLRRKSMLLLMDNFEHMAEGGSELLVDILQVAPGVRILVTSRERVQLHEEQVYPLQGLEHPGLDMVEAIGNYDAVKLFMQSAGRVRPGFELQADDKVHITRVCRLLEGMPLGIELAAAWVDMLTPAEIAAEIIDKAGSGLDFLETEMRDIPQRHRSLRATIDVSWQRLTESERDVMARLSVFRGGFTRRAAQGVTGASLRSLARLANKSLLRFSKARDRYQIHELLRQYAAEKLALNPDHEIAARDDHCTYYCQALARWEDDLKGARQLAALAEMAADIDNTWAAWHWAVDQVKTKRLAQALDGLCLFYDMRARFQEGERACRLALEKLAELKTEDADGLRLQARVLAWQGLFVRWRRGTKQAHQLWEQSLALLEKPELASQDTRPERAFILMLRGEHSWWDVNIGVEVAIEVAEESLALYRALGDRWGTARALSAMGDIIVNRANPGQAKPFLEESLAIRRAIGDQWGIADSLDGLSGVAGFQGQLAEGERLNRESLAIYRKTGDQRSIGMQLWGIGSTLVWQGRFAEAKPLADEYLAISDDLGSDRFIAWANSLAGFPDLYLGAYAEAKAQAQRGLALSCEIDFEWAIGLSAFILGFVALAEEVYDEARHWFQETLAVFPAHEDFTSGGQALACLGYIARGSGRPAQAKRYLYEALAGASERRVFLPLIHALPGVALLLADEGEKERAVELYALAKTQGMVANSKWFEDIAGRHIAAVASTLPPGVAAEAEARGKARELWETAAELSAELKELGWGA